jgi:hypothetical protein
MHDYVMLWNAVALELNRRDHTGKMNANSALTKPVLSRTVRAGR